MPRKAPDSVQEMRLTFGNYERQFVKEVKTDIEKVAKVALIAPVAVGVGGLAVGVGVASLGWFAMKGLQGFALGIPDLLSPLDKWTSKWFYFTNSKTGEEEFNLTNWYDYIFNNQEADAARAKSQAKQEERTSGKYDLDNIATNDDGSVWMAPEVDIPFITPDEKEDHTNTGGKGTADYDEDEGSNWPFTEDWWPF
jgi:hypothetical protein